MTATFVAASTAVTGLNASLTPTLPAGTAVGDVVFILASIRNSGTGVPATPSGWTRGPVFVSTNNIQLFRRLYDGVWTMPTVTFTGGTATDDTLAQAATFRGIVNATDNSTGQLNGSAQDITLPSGITPSRGNALVLYIGWKQDDLSSAAAVSGTTKISDVSSTAGNDSSMTWSYQIQGATPAASTTGTIAVTGGAAAISRAGVGMYLSTVTLTAATRDTWPPRVVVSLSPLTTGDDVQLYRVVAGERAAVRGGSQTDVTDPSLVCIDAELPFGVPVSYVAVVNGTTEYTTSPVTYTLTGGKVALTDAITGLAAEVVIVTMGGKSHDRAATVFKAGGRNVVVSGDWGQYTSSLELYLETTSSSENLENLLAGATENTIQVRQPGGYPGVDAYLSVLSATDSPFSDRGSDERRIWNLSVAEVDSWADELEARDSTLEDVADYYGVSGTLADIHSDISGTLLDLALKDFS